MTRRAIVVLGLFVLSLAGAVITGKSLMFSLTYIWGGLLIMSFVWARLALRGVVFLREPRTLRAQVGHIFLERFTIINKSRFPKLWIEVRDRSELPGQWVSAYLVGSPFQSAIKRPGHRASAVISGLGPGKESTWMVRTLCTRRGRFRLGPAELLSGDPFGLFRSQKEVPIGHHVVVLPMTVPVHSFPIPGARRPGGEALRQHTFRITPNAASVRDYAPGDGFNRIHWPSTARRERLIVKEFEFDPMAEVWIVLDAARIPQAAIYDEQITSAATTLEASKTPSLSLPFATEEYGVAAAASLGFHLIHHDRSVGLVTHGKARHVIQADRGEAQLQRILQSLAVLDAIGRVGMREVLKIDGERIPRGGTVILITPDVRPEVLDTARSLKRVARNPVLVLLDAETFGGEKGTMELATTARREGIPVRVVRCGEPLEASLASSLLYRPSLPTAA
jgi:uncharacterized protein (DUF58 family)